MNNDYKTRLQEKQKEARKRSEAVRELSRERTRIARDQARERAQVARDQARERAVAYNAKLVRLGVHAQYLQLFWVAAVATVLLTRAFLAATGYPQIAGGTLHIAHALWGGLFMGIGLVAALVLIGPFARAIISVVGGIGVGLFFDEVGKFITKTNDYFFRPAAAIIYVLFAALLVLTIRVRATRPNDPKAAAAAIAADGAIEGLTPNQRRRALEWLDDAPVTQTTEALRHLIEASPDRKGWKHPEWLVAIENQARAVAQQRYLIALGIVLLLASRMAVAGFLIGHTDVHDPSPQGIADAVSSVSRTIEVALVAVGAARWLINHRNGYRWLYGGIFLNLYFTQVFNFSETQFAALTELPYLVLILLALRHYQEFVAKRDANGSTEVN